MLYRQRSELGVPGTYWDDYYNYGADSTFQMQLYIWTGTETTYSSALADGQYTPTPSGTKTSQLRITDRTGKCPKYLRA